MNAKKLSTEDMVEMLETLSDQNEIMHDALSALREELWKLLGKVEIAMRASEACE